MRVEHPVDVLGVGWVDQGSRLMYNSDEGAHPGKVLRAIDPHDEEHLKDGNPHH